MTGLGRGRWAVSQKAELIQTFHWIVVKYRIVVTDKKITTCPG